LKVLDVSITSITGGVLSIQRASGRNVLVDGGPSSNALSEALGRRLPFGRQKWDNLAVAAPGEAQVTELPRDAGSLDRDRWLCGIGRGERRRRRSMLSLAFTAFQTTIVRQLFIYTYDATRMNFAIDIAKQPRYYDNIGRFYRQYRAVSFIH